MRDAGSRFADGRGRSGIDGRQLVRGDANENGAKTRTKMFKLLFIRGSAVVGYPDSIVLQDGNAGLKKTHTDVVVWMTRGNKTVERKCYYVVRRSRLGWKVEAVCNLDGEGRGRFGQPRHQLSNIKENCGE